MASSGGSVYSIFDASMCWRCRAQCTQILNQLTSKKSCRAARPVTVNHRRGFSSARGFSTTDPRYVERSHEKDARRFIHSSSSAPQQQAKYVSKHSRMTRERQSEAENVLLERLRERRKQQGIDIRSKLRRWQSQKHLTPTPLEPPPKAEHVNDLTRPEQLAQHVGGTVERLDEQLTEFMASLDTTIDYTGTANMDYVLLRAGDLVSVEWSTEVPVLGVFLRWMNGRNIFYTARGTFYASKDARPVFVSRNYFTPSELDKLQESIQAQSGLHDPDIFGYLDIKLARDSAAPILSKLKDFADKANNAFRNNSSILSDAHKLLADRNQRKFLSLEQIAAALTGSDMSDVKEYPEHFLFSISHTLLRRGFGFSANKKSFALTRVMAVEARVDIEAVQKVEKWTRAYQEEEALLSKGDPVPLKILSDASVFRAFVDRAQKRITQTRQSRAPLIANGMPYSYSRANGNDTSDSQLSQGFEEHFTHDDKLFIHVLKLAVCAQAFEFSSNISAIVPSTILRATRLYDEAEDLGKRVGFTFLTEIGVLNPFSFPVAIDRDLLPRLPSEVFGELFRIKEEVNSGIPLPKAANLVDSMANLRKDWGNLPVFCIDSASTTDVDDGISIEQIPGIEDETWVHVHISHPTAFIPKDHPIERAAANAMSSFYLPDKRIPMMLEHITDEFSLAPGKAVLTISARLGPMGKVLETRIRPGIIRNVIFLDIETADEVLGQSRTTDDLKYRLLVGNADALHKFSRTNLATELSADETSTLKLLEKTLQDRSAQKPWFGGLVDKDKVLTYADLQLAMPEGRSYLVSMQRVHQARHTLADPTILYQTFASHARDSGTSSGSRASDLVREAMVLAGALAADWAAERNIPLFYHGTRPPTDDSSGEIASSLNARIKRALERPSEMPSVVRNVGAFFRRLVASEPVVHRAMDLDQYTKITSPLRRYHDFVSQLQLNAALLEEHRTGQSLVGTNDNYYLPYQKKDIDELIRFSYGKDDEHKYFSLNCQRHWTVCTIARAHFHGEAELPKPLVAAVTMIQGPEIRGFLGQLHTPCVFSTETLSDDTPCVIGDRWEVEINSIDAYAAKLFVKPIKKVSGAAGPE